MSFFQQQPKSVKKVIRYILQDVHSLDTLEQLEKMIRYYIQKRKRE
ncbi:LytR family transcriptional regulator [Geobacillus sp. BK01]